MKKLLIFALLFCSQLSLQAQTDSLNIREVFKLNLESLFDFFNTLKCILIANPRFGVLKHFIDKIFAYSVNSLLCDVVIEKTSQT